MKNHHQWWELIVLFSKFFEAIVLRLLSKDFGVLFKKYNQHFI